MVRGRGTLLRGEERAAAGAGDVATSPAGTDVVHAFVADSGEEMEFLSIGGGKDNDAVLSTPTRASCWWPGLLARTGSTGAWVGHLQEADYFDGELQRPARPY